MLVSVHLPNRTKCTREGICLENVMKCLADALDVQWLCCAWNVLVVGGDFNIQLPPNGSLGPGVSGSEWGERQDVLWSFAQKYQLEWTSTQVPANSYTHLHYRHKTQHVIDYVLVSTSAGTRTVKDVDIKYEACFDSDHYPIYVNLSIDGKKPRPKKKHFHHRVFDLKVQNRFQVLLEDCIDDIHDDVHAEPVSKITLGDFGRCLTNAIDIASKIPFVRAEKQSIRQALHVQFDGVNNALDPASRRAALKILAHAKRQIIRTRNIEKFANNALTAPRDDKAKKCGTMPMSINGALSFVPAQWETEFRSAYKDLFVDCHNSADVQDDRLQRLRVEMQCEDRILVPQFLVSEVLSQGRRKSGTAPGSDRITWSALNCLPERAICILTKLIQHRVNGDGGHEMVLQEWCDVCISMIPKITSPTLVKHWRPIALTSCLQKLYLAVVTRLVAYFCTPCLPNQCGFSQGRQTAEVSELTRLALQKAVQWNVPLYALKLDVHRAFDAMKHDVILQSLVGDGCPLRLQHAIMVELSHTQISIKFQGHLWSGMEYSRGGRQGGSETPELWKRLLNSALLKAKAIWDDLHLGAHFGTRDTVDYFHIDFMAWADDIVLYANSLDDIHSMFSILSNELHRVHLQWKPGSAELLRSTAPWAARSFQWDFAGGKSLGIALVHRFILLGVAVDAAATDTAAVDFRIGQAWVHWHARKRVLCDNSIPLKLRWAKIRETIFRTVLHGAGGWRICSSVQQKLHTFELKLLKLTLCRTKHDDESDGEFHHRLHVKINELKQAFGWTELRVLAMSTHWTWWGHVARLPEYTPLKRLTGWRSLGWRNDATVGNKPRMSRSGPVTSFEDVLFRAVGADWRTSAQDRKTWQDIRSWAVQQHFANNALGIGTMGFLQHISSKTRDFTRGCIMKTPLRLLHVIDNLQVVQQTLGRWTCGLSCPYASFVHYLRWGFHVFQQVWKFSPPVGYAHCIVHKRRHLNSYADWLANRALDTNSVLSGFRRLLLYSGDCVVLSTDGACRGNPGLSSAAACLQLFREGELIGALAWCACPLGESTNVHAEFESACLGVRLVASWCFYSGICDSG